MFQFTGALTALFVANYLQVVVPTAFSEVFTLRLFIAEVLGTALFTFGIAAVVTEAVPALLSGIVVGGSLLLGILVSSLGGSLGILNPAVAFALHTPSFTAIWAPIIGSIIGFYGYQYLKNNSCPPSRDM